jgi:hypothetical protein
LRRFARVGGGVGSRPPVQWLRSLARSAFAGSCVLGLAACAAPKAEPQGGTSVLLSSPAAPASTGETAVAEPDRARAAHAGAIALPFRGPGPGGTAYRLVMEVSGERVFSVSTDLEAREPLQESHLLELEYRELPVAGTSEGEQAYLLALDGLHYRLQQQNPAAEREIEVASDRLRVGVDGKVALDLRGTQPKEDLTPRSLLGRVFAVVVHDAMGNPLRIQPRGVPAARRFLHGLQVTQAIGYSRLALPAEEIAPGAVWHSQRFPASPSGALGLSLDVEYTLAGLRELDGVACAWIVFRAGEDAEGFPSAAGFEFERVVASLAGEAFVELETSRVRRLVLEDEIRAGYTTGGAPGPTAEHRLRHKSRLLLVLRDPEEEPDTWEDGSTRFGRR